MQNQYKLYRNDIIQLFLYYCGLSETFPRDNIASGSIGRYVNLSKDMHKPQDDGVPPDCNGATHIMIVRHIGEMRKQAKEQTEIINKLSKRVNDLEEVTVKLQTELAIYQTKSTTLDDDDAAGTQGIQFHFGEQGSPIGGGLELFAKADHHKALPLDPEIEIILSQNDAQHEHNANEDSEWEDVNTDEQVDEDATVTVVEVTENNKKVKKGNAIEPKSNKKDGSEEFGKMFSDMLKEEGPWLLDKTSMKKINKKLKVTLRNTPNGGRQRIVEKGENNGPSLITGLKREPSTLMYVRNIAVNDRSDDDVCRDIKIFGKMVGLRVMYAGIVKNRYCQDVVGCKIRIPVCQIEKATDIQTWPDDVECRKWEKRAQQGYNDRSRNFRS